MKAQEKKGVSSFQFLVSSSEISAQSAQPETRNQKRETCSLFNEDVLKGIDRIDNESIDLIIADPPYGLGKDYGNDSDKLNAEDYLDWSKTWIDAVLPKLKPKGSFYIFLTWQYSPEIFSFMKTRLTMMNEIIWDRSVPSMGGSVRKFSSVHDTVGFFVKGEGYYFDLDAVRIPYDPVTKKARTRSIFVGAKWLEVGYNPKDVWRVARLHREHKERENHPTQKPLEIIDRMVLASSPKEGLVFDPFMGSGTTAVSALKLGRRFVGFEINPDYFVMIQKRIKKVSSSEFLVSSSNISAQLETRNQKLETTETQMQYTLPIEP